MNAVSMKNFGVAILSNSRTKLVGVVVSLAVLAAGASCSHFRVHVPPRTIHADVVALDQELVYNRFGSKNPYGMIYALKRDVVSTTDGKPMNERSKPGEVRLRHGKRPRPLVLRVAPGDHLVVHFTNMLSPEQPDLSSKHWDPPYTNLNKKELEPLPGETEEKEEPEPAITGEATTMGCGSELATGNPPNPADRRNDWPRTRCASITVSGLTPTGNTFDPITTGIAGIAPGHSVTYQWDIPSSNAPSTHLFFSNAAPAGGEGDGGSLVHGLFGALHVEPKGSEWYRSQTTQEEYKRVTDQRQGSALLNYEAVESDDTPILNMLKPRGAQEFDLVHGDLNAIVVDHKLPESPAFREFTAVFHDELKTFYRDEFVELEQSFTLSGVRDGFGINYGASGMGTILLANRKGIGPAKNCVECAYEEFFLESWANGDPALLPEFADDPSNVHHSYLNDRVEFRNLHAGPKETHVFHLHAHQWLAQQQDTTGTYLDSQTIAPQQGFVYPIFYGGSGNRNKTPGDSIFHCHLYPHFAQGMWELWRVHDVFEDGSRRLPDGELGPGTDPKTGVTNKENGTPIPAVIPLPGQAMPPVPGYGPDQNPGFPLFIAGQVGHRAPQPPMDMVRDGGLPRHVITSGTRSVSHLSHAEIQKLEEDRGKVELGKEVLHRALSTGDMTVKLESAHIEVLPEDGTASEKAAMAFHAKSEGHPSVKPDGTPSIYEVNGRAPQKGAPFADPCDVNVAKLAGQVDKNGGLLYRNYRVSAIDIDMVVNHEGWHDPQGRINVLDDDVKNYVDRKGKARAKTDQAKPFFFRANSGECVTYEHTNRTAHELELDDFQVRTPTDTIGQHIHLVKFDVMSSDGSGNGWNYEDGTFAQGSIRERIEASHKPGGQAVDAQGRPTKLSLPAPDQYQTTIQRWFADPLMEDLKTCEASGGVRGLPSLAPKACRDRTIRTVFTHDHFGPSSIQHHGFYSALLIEPSGSQWRTPNGDPLTDGVGTQAMIVNAEDPSVHPNHREFALAVADFALLYDPHRQHGENPAGTTLHGMQNLIKKAGEAQIDKPTVTRLKQHAQDYWQEHGQPVDPPSLPEAISKDHHNPYLVNYRHEPIPLRIGLRDTDGSIKRQKLGLEGDMAFVFDSRVHGDPASEIFEGYEGELTQLRVIQGAQEVQHMMNIHGMRWPREIANPQSPLVAAQEIGISEHFELKLPLANVFRGAPVADYLYDFGSVDDLWNGAWGLIRAYNGVDAADPQSEGVTYKEYAEYIAHSTSREEQPSWYRPIKNRLKPLQEGGSGQVDLVPEKVYLDGTCPEPVSHVDGRTSEVTFYIDAVSVGDWLGKDLPYDRNGQVFDPNALTYVLLDRLPVGAIPLTDAELEDRRIQLKAHYTRRLHDPVTKTPIEPLVLRANAGDCIKIELSNRLPKNLGDARGDALMPKIVPLNVEQDSEEGGSGAEDVRPSSFVTLHPQLVSYNVANYNGAAVGFNGESPIAAGTRGLPSYWYAGVVKVDGNMLKHEPYEFGAINLTSWGDIINQPSHGLVGTLIIEPKGSTYHDPSTGEQVPNGGISAVIRYPEGGMTHAFREHVVMYRDGLNLHYTKSDGKSGPLPDCRICDDSYDLGDKAFNYHTAPFQIRLGQAPEANLNEAFYPTNFLTPQYKPIPTTEYTALPKEEVRFRVLQPHGRARQHAFLLYGHDFQDILPYYGSPHSPLMSVGKAMTVKIPHAQEGYWLYRDGPAQMWSGGLWGSFQVGEPKQSGK